MKKILLFLAALLVASSVIGQVASYTFSQSAGTFTPISGGTVLGSGTIDDNVYNANNIGFNFYFNGVWNTQFSVNVNGWLCMGPVAVSSYTALSTGTSNNVIAALSRDLQGLTNGELRYEVIGTTPNRTLVLQWLHFKKYGTTGTGDDWNFQIRLHETSCAIDLVYGSYIINATSTTVQVGLRGGSNADFNNRTTTTNWAATTAGVSNTDACTVSSTVFPASGQTFTYTPPPIPPSITYTPLANTGSTTARTLTTTIYSPYGIPISGIGLPRLYWRINTGSWNFAPGVFVSGNTYTFTFGAGVVLNDVVQYYIVVQDASVPPILAASPSAGIGTLTPNPPTASSPPTTPNSYTIIGSICGTFNVGAGQTYTTLTAAIADLNNKEITCPVTFLLTDAAYTAETFPIIINNNNGSSATNVVTIKPAPGVTPTISGVSTSALIKFNGASYMTIDGSNSGGTDISLTFSNTSASGTTAVVWVGSNGTAAGSSYITIKNCNIANGYRTSGAYGIVAGASSGITTAGNDNDNLTIQNNLVSMAYVGIWAQATAAGMMDNLQIIGNSLGSATAGNYLGHDGIMVAQATGALISQNTIYNIITSATTPVGITASTGVVSSTISRNNINNITYTGTGGYGGRGMYINTGTATSNLTFANNLIAVILGDGYTSFTNSSPVGMYFDGTTGGHNIYHNSVYLSGNITRNSATLTAAILFYTTTVTNIDLRNNIFMNTIVNTVSATGKSYAIYSNAPATSFTQIDYNDYFAGGTQAVLGYLGADILTLTAWQTATGKDVNSINVDPAFVSTTDLHPTAPAIQKACPYIAAVSNDYSGTLRTNPTDIGAYQVSTGTQTVTTNAATAIGQTTATLNGSINANNLIVTSGYDYGLTVAYGSSIAGVPATITGTGSTPFTGSVSGLTPATLYHYRAKGTSGGLIVYGNDMTFTTTPSFIPPTVVTLAATGITATGATLNGTVNPNGYSSTVSFDYGLTTAYGTNIAGVPSPVTGTSPVPVSANISGLTPGTLYHFRVKGINAGGTTNGNDLTFTTPLPPPTVVTLPATGIVGTSATMNGTINPNNQPTTSSFDYGFTTAYGTNVAGVPPNLTGNTAQPVSYNLTGLTNNSVYHYRINGVSAGGTSNGNDMSFVIGCPAAGPAGPITGPTQVCQGGCSYTYSVTILNAAGYVWTLPVGGTITAGANTSTITVCYAANASPGYVFVYGTAPCGNGSPSQLAIAMNPPASPTITGPASVCVNSTGNVYTTETGKSNYVWTVSAGGTITAGGTPTSNTATVTWNTAGAQTVSVNYNTPAGCSAITPTVYNVTVNALPVPTISGPNPACSNFPGLVYSTQAGMTGYAWTISAGGTITGGAGTNAITVTWTATGAQSVSVNYTNTSGCTGAAPVAYPVTVNNGAAPTITGANNLCVNSGYYSYTTETGMTGYTWTISAGGVINYGSGTNVITVSWTAPGAQWVRVNYTNPSGCQAATSTQYDVTVTAPPGPAGSITGTANVCGGANGVAYSTPAITGALTYVWTLPAGATIVSGAGTNTITVDFAGNASSGDITVYGNNLCGNGAGSPPFAVTVSPLPADAGTITGPAAVCQGATGQVYLVPAILGATGYVWTVPAGAVIMTGANTNAITVDFGATAVSGVISVYGTNSCGNGNPSPDFNLTVNPIPSAPVVTNTGYTVYSSAPAGNQWYYSDTQGGTGAPISGATSQTYDCTQTGTGYYWSVVTLNDCSSDTSNHKYVVVTGIESHPAASINIYPVPNDGKFTVSFSGSSNEKYTISVFSYLGVKIFEETNVEVNGSLQKVIDLRPVPNGVYTVIFENNLKQVVKRIVVNK